MKLVFLITRPGDLVNLAIYTETNRICPPSEGYLLVVIPIDLSEVQQCEVARKIIRAATTVTVHTVAFAGPGDPPRQLIAECLDRMIMVLVGVWSDAAFSHFERVVELDLTTERV